MEKVISYGICLVLLFFSIKGSVVTSFYEGSSKYAFNRMLYYFSILISFMIVTINLDVLFEMILSLSSQNFILTQNQNNIFKVIVLISTFFIIKFIIYRLLKLLVSPFFSNSNNHSIKSKVVTVLLSSIFGTIKGFILIVIMFIGVTTYNNTIGREITLNIFNNIRQYNNIDKIIKIRDIEVKYADFKDVISSGDVLIYYNGVTLEDGIKSSEEINSKARELASFSSSDIEKAKNIYSWIGSNIEYDFEKAEKALNNEDTGRSGAIEAWETRSGICFDYACLYVAMAREVGLKVRLVTGEAYDGRQFGPHAWNEVYISEEDRWINVDPTFYLAGNYFDNYDFFDDHIKENIAGEW